MKTLAVHLHLYYLEQLPEMLERLRSLNEQSYDLFVTMVKHDKKAESDIKAFNSQANIMIVPNKGYDLGPFIAFLHKIDLSKYKYVLKIHTKGNKSQNYTWLNGNRLDNKLWKQILLDALLKDSQRVCEDLALLDNNPNMGMLSSKYCVASEKRTYQKFLPQVNEFLEKNGLDKVNKVSFVAGTMFYVRAGLLKPLLKYTIEDFAESNNQVKEGTLAHIVERLLGALVSAQGYGLYGIKHDNYTKGFIVAAIKRFLYQKKKTAKGYTIIKVCRIPVWHRKGV